VPLLYLFYNLELKMDLLIPLAVSLACILKLLVCVAGPFKIDVMRSSKRRLAFSISVQRSSKILSFLALIIGYYRADGFELSIRAVVVCSFCLCID
jgi:hypothetical protein